MNRINESVDTDLVIGDDEINNCILEAFLCKWLTALRLLLKLRRCTSVVLAIIANSLFCT
jgi:hypothetical protein